ncbi:hypothetical protein [Streptomyces sp. MJP52]|uniref:hypothetical protein n=1 Tax=Streptomyces sp. MJP52 TaxID=2940555 RepID=UPI002476E13C|nr:hypothetical protein [Streptomyces sp. MJP52]MDH6225395.1 hypothetical protein [Streptomyces sp. MJP52]
MGAGGGTGGGGRAGGDGRGGGVHGATGQRTAVDRGHGRRAERRPGPRLPRAAVGHHAAPGRHAGSVGAGPGALAVPKTAHRLVLTFALALVPAAEGAVVAGRRGA